ncbi:hypothetical protein INR49_017208 [Caranx melampygus]|nr:hypothetical protein INR49_017208 [Caranx melampygus]
MASAPAPSGETCSMEDHLTCSICMDTFQDPVTTACGHSFCKECLCLSYECTDRVCPMCKRPLKRVPGVNIVLRDIVQQRKVEKMKEEDEDIYTDRNAVMANDLYTEEKRKDMDDWARHYVRFLEEDLGFVPSEDKQEKKRSSLRSTMSKPACQQQQDFSTLPRIADSKAMKENFQVTAATIKAEPKSPVVIPPWFYPGATNPQSLYQLPDFSTGVQAVSSYYQPQVNGLTREYPPTPPSATATQPKKKDGHDKVRELARMFSATTTKETAGQPQKKQPLSQAKLLAPQFSATTAQRVAVQPKEKKVSDSSGAITNMNPAAAETTSEEVPTSSCETAELPDFSAGLKTPDTINMSLQVCHCGWSKVTSYHGLRTHQGKMGCTPKGMHIPESKGLSFLPPVTFMSPQIKDPVLDILNIPWKYDLKVKEIMSIPEKQPHVWRNPDQKDSTPLSSTPAKEEILNMSDLSLQEMTGCPPRIPEDKGWRNGSFAQLTFITPPDTPEETAVDIFSTKSVVENQQQTVQMGGSSDKTHQRLDAQALQTFSSQMCPAAADVTVKEMNQPFFGTPQRSHPTTAKLDKARRVLDFSTGAQQVQQTCDSLFQRHDGTQIQFNPVYHARQDRKRAELQHKVKIRENQVAQVRSSVKGCKVSLDAEWLEINSAFSEVIKVVEDARQKALQPLEERREKIKREEQALVQKLEKEIDKLKKSIEEVDKNPDLQISPDKPGHWKNVSVDTSFSFGTLRTTTSAMMEEIRQKLETLCSVAPPVSLSLKQKPQKVGVFVDYEEGLVSFYDVTAQSHIYSFTGCSFGDGWDMSYSAPCQSRSDFSQFRQFVRRHILQESFNRNSNEAWGSYLDRQNLCGRTWVQSFTEAPKTEVIQICSSRGRRLGKRKVAYVFNINHTNLRGGKVDAESLLPVWNQLIAESYVLIVKIVQDLGCKLERET